MDNKVLILRGNGTDVGNLAAGDIIVFYQAGAPATAIASSSTFVGVDAIVTNTGSLFNISAATYNLWKGNTYSLPTAAPLTMSALHGASTRVVVRGGYGDITFLMSPYAWQDICDDQAALRRYADTNKKEFVNGATELTFYGTNGGKMVLRPHPMVKAGDCFGLMTDEWCARASRTSPTASRHRERGLLPRDSRQERVRDPQLLEPVRVLPQAREAGQDHEHRSRARRPEESTSWPAS